MQRRPFTDPESAQPTPSQRTSCRPATVQQATVQQAIAGDHTAFGQLVDEYKGMVTGVAYSVLGDFSRSEDAGQEAFLEAWRNRDSLKDPGKFASWVCTIARHRALDLARKTSRPAERGNDVHEADPVSIQATAEEVASTNEEKQLVWSSLDSLPQKYRDVMVLYYRGEQSVSQVAASLGESEPTIRQRLVRGRAMLKDEVESIVQRTLRGTAPKLAFVGAVIGSLPGNTSAAFAGTASVATAGKGGSLAAATTAAVGSTVGGAAVGTFGGLLGGGIGTFLSYRNAPYTGQKKLLLRYAIAMCFSMIVFTVVIGCLVAKQQSDTPLDGRTYSITLLSVIFGFQLILFGSSILMMLKYKRLAANAKATNEPFDPSIAARLGNTSTSTAQSYTSERAFLGRPLIDIQRGPAMSDGTVEEPKTARGWIAIGDVACGLLFGAGSRARGLIAVGGLCVGGITLGGFGFGIVNFCGVSVGLFSLGGLALGYVAFGGLALGANACGGAAGGMNAVGGAAFGWQHADGGLAWSQGVARGGVVLSGETGKAAFAKLDSHWFISMAKNAMTSNIDPGQYSLAGQISFAFLIAAFFAVVLATVWYRRVFLVRLANESIAQSDLGGHVTDPQAMINNDHGAFFGSLLGCTAWSVWLVTDSGKLELIMLPAATYLAGLAACGIVYWMKRNAEDSSLFVHLSSCLIMAGSTAAVISFAVFSQRWVDYGMDHEDFPAFPFPLASCTLALVIITHAGMALIMSESRRLNAN